MTNLNHIYFSAIHAVKIYQHFNQYEFHPTVPGQLIARRFIKSNKKDEKNRKLYSVANWETLWEDMYKLHKSRADYDNEISKPHLFEAPDINSEICFNIIMKN